MPNYCDFKMKIVGLKENCEAFVQRLKSYTEPNHFWRIFVAEVFNQEQCGDHIALYIDGFCAWSLESCCRASGYSDGIDLFAVNTKELSLKMEAYSREPGIEFEEHYIYDNGICVSDECKDILVYQWDEAEFPKYADYKREYVDVPPESSFDENNEAIVGGFGIHFGEWHI